MISNNQLLLTALITSHPGGRVAGRTRLQKEVKLLQRLEFPTDYSYLIHFYGPYSESLQSDLGLMHAYGLITETCEAAPTGADLYILQAQREIELPDISEFSPIVGKMNRTPLVVLELAATYDAFREMGDEASEALQRLRLKKGSKCTAGNERAALEFLEGIGLTP